jgi:hypothetical protein
MIKDNTLSMKNHEFEIRMKDTHEHLGSVRRPSGNGNIRAMDMGYSCINFWVLIDVTASYKIKNSVQINYFLSKIIYIFDGLNWEN